MMIDTQDSSYIFSLSSHLKNLFEMLLIRIEERKDTLETAIEEYTEGACYEVCMRFIEEFGIYENITHLSLLAKFIACESSVAYSISGVVDVLDSQYRTKRIVGSYIAALLYLMQIQIN